MSQENDALVSAHTCFNQGHNFSPVLPLFYPCFDSVVGPEYRSRYSNALRDGLFVNRVAVVVRFSAPVQTGDVDHPAS